MFGKNWLKSGILVVFEQNWLYLDKLVFSGKVVVFGQNCCT